MKAWRETTAIIADREWRMGWAAWRLRTERLHTYRQMYPAQKGYRWLYR